MAQILLSLALIFLLNAGIMEGRPTTAAISPISNDDESALKKLTIDETGRSFLLPLGSPIVSPQLKINTLNQLAHILDQPLRIIMKDGSENVEETIGTNEIGMAPKRSRRSDKETGRKPPFDTNVVRCRLDLNSPGFTIICIRPVSNR